MKARVGKILVLIFLSSSAVFAQELSPSVIKDSQQIFSEINSPYCPGRLLRDCPSGAASELKEEITVALQNGKSKDELKSDLLTRFGADINPLPSFGGFGLVAWVVPLLFCFMGLLIIGKRVRQGRKGSMEEPKQEKRAGSTNHSRESQIDALMDDIN